MKKKYVVVGGCGFIGSALVDALLSNPDPEIEVCVLDNLSSGKPEHLKQHENDTRLLWVETDVTRTASVRRGAWIFKDTDAVFHLAANPDARLGIADTNLDLLQETVATRNVLEEMRLAGCKRIIFSSSGTVYGDCGETVCREGQGERLPISLYGAGKVASEALISAFCGTFGMKGVIFRFGNVIGERSTHGAVFDWLKQLREHPDHLTVLGDGNQSKPYIYVKEVVAGMLHGLKLLNRIPDGKCQPFNLAPDGATTVRFMACELVKQMRASDAPMPVQTTVEFGSTPQGWAGDVPHCRMDSTKLRNTGFAVTMTSDDAVRHGIKKILDTL
jgi:UDP-glucose 4-epimerase